MTVFFQFDEPDAFTAGTVGRPGQRTFYLQIRADDQQVTIKCEKQQVEAMAEYLRGLLADVPPPDEAPGAAAMEFAAPFDQAFVLGPIGLAFDRDTGRFIVQLEELVPAPESDDVLIASGDDPAAESSDDDVERSTVRSLLSPAQVVAFCERAEELVSSGRPTCVFCGGPMDPDGHACPRMN